MVSPILDAYLLRLHLSPSPSCITSLVKFSVEQLDVHPNTANKDGETLLFKATSNGYEAVVKVLLELQDINPNTRNKNLTRLRSIAWNRGEGVMKVLLELFDVDSDSQHKDGQKPLFISACYGHDRVVIV